MLDHSSVEANEKAKYLGVLLDSKLDFQQHFNHVESKVLKAVGIMFKLKSILTQEALLKLYYALVHPYLLYGIIAWESTFPSYLNKLNTLQNKRL